MSIHTDSVYKFYPKEALMRYKPASLQIAALIFRHYSDEV